MPYRELLGPPLDINPDAPPKRLTECALYPEFAERFGDAFDLIDEGQYLWEDFYVSGQGWDPLASQVVSDVSYMASNIRQSFNRYPSVGLAEAIRRSRLKSDGVSDTQLVAALAMDRACRSVQILWTWINWIENDARLADLPHTAQISMAPPDIYLEIVNEHRATCPHLEIEARESAAIYIGDARNYMTLAHVYATPALSDELKARISRQAITESRREISRRNADKSAQIRTADLAPRNGRIGSTYKVLIQSGQEHNDAVKNLCERFGLRDRQLKKILAAEKVWEPRKKLRK